MLAEPEQFSVVIWAWFIVTFTGWYSHCSISYLLTHLIVKYFPTINKLRYFLLFETDSLVIDPWLQGEAPKLLIDNILISQ